MQRRDDFLLVNLAQKLSNLQSTLLDSVKFDTSLNNRMNEQWSSIIANIEALVSVDIEIRTDYKTVQTERIYLLRQLEDLDL